MTLQSSVVVSDENVPNQSHIREYRESIADVRVGGRAWYVSYVNKELRLCLLFQSCFLRECKAIKMDKRDENGTEESDQEQEEDSQKETINVITCREHLSPFFEQSDHSINKVHFSKVNK